MIFHPKKKYVKHLITIINQPQYQNPYNNQPQYYNPPPIGDAQQVNQAYPDKAPYYVPSNNYNDDNDVINLLIDLIENE